MLQAIRVRYLSPTNRIGARFSVSAAAGRMYVPYEHKLNMEQNVKMAALVYAKTKQWDGHYMGGQMENGDYVFVHVKDGDDMDFTLQTDGGVIS